MRNKRPEIQLRKGPNKMRGQIAEGSPSPSGRGQGEGSRFDGTRDPHAALRALLSQRERERPPIHSHVLAISFSLSHNQYFKRVRQKRPSPLTGRWRRSGYGRRQKNVVCLGV